MIWWWLIVSSTIRTNPLKTNLLPLSFFFSLHDMIIRLQWSVWILPNAWSTRVSPLFTVYLLEKETVGRVNNVTECRNHQGVEEELVLISDADGCSKSPTGLVQSAETRSIRVCKITNRGWFTESGLILANSRDHLLNDSHRFFKYIYEKRKTVARVIDSFALPKWPLPIKGFFLQFLLFGWKLIKDSRE